jgi:hypothetical protein
MVRGGIQVGLLLIMAMVGCAPTEPEPGESGREGNALTQTAEDGPVKLTVTVDKVQAAIAEPIRLTVTAVAPDWVEVTLPEVAKELSGLEVVETSVAMPMASVDGRRQWSQGYTLEAYAGGEYQIPSLGVAYSDSGNADQGTTSQPAQSGEVKSEPISIAIASAIEGEADPSAFRDIKPLAAVKLDRSRAWLWWVASLLVLGLASALIWRRRGGQDQAAEVVIAPHEWAFGQLDQLLSDDLIRRGEVHEYYFRLSGITREYIERRFQVSAPEMTTEEFLIQVGDARYLDESQKQALAMFLGACDLVKFAKHEPSSTEIDHAFDAAKEFVSQTAPLSEDASGAVGREAAA